MWSLSSGTVPPWASPVLPILLPRAGALGGTREATRKVCTLGKGLHVPRPGGGSGSVTALAKATGIGSATELLRPGRSRGMHRKRLCPCFPGPKSHKPEARGQGGFSEGLLLGGWMKEKTFWSLGPFSTRKAA